MADKQKRDRLIDFEGGVLTDAPAVLRPVEDLVNLLPPHGMSKGLQQRPGVEALLQLDTDDTFGVVIHQVTLDDMARTKLIVLQDAVTKSLLHITEHTDMEGRLSIPPVGGGELPVTPEEEQVFGNLLYFAAATAAVGAGETITLTVNAHNAGGTADVGIDFVTAVDGEDLDDGTGTVTATEESAGYVSITVSEDATPGRAFDVYLRNPAADDTYLKSPSVCRVEIDSAIEYVKWRPIIAGNDTLDDQDINKTVIFMHSDTYDTRTELLDWSDIHDVDVNYITTKNLLVAGALEVFGGGDVGSGIGVFDLAEIADNPGAALHAPANVWATDYANEFLVWYWVDRLNNMVAIYERWDDGEWRLYTGPALEAKPASYTVVDKTGFGANFSTVYSDGANDYEDVPIIFGDGKMGVKNRDFPNAYGLGWVKTDGTTGLCAAAPAYSDYWYNAMSAPKTGNNTVVLTRQNTSGDAVEMFKAADIDTAPTQVTESGVALTFDNSMRIVSDKTLTRFLGRGPDDGAILVNLSVNTLTSVATYPVDGGHANNETFGNDWIDDDRAILLKKDETDLEFQVVVIDASDTGASLHSDTVGTFTSSTRYKQVMDAFAYRCINMNGVIE